MEAFVRIGIVAPFASLGNRSRARRGHSGMLALHKKRKADPKIANAVHRFM